MCEQQIIIIKDNYKELEKILLNNNIKNIYLICGKSFEKLKISWYFYEIVSRLKIQVTKFDDFTANPRYESVKKAIQIFNRKEYDIIIAVGGGSAIDVAKCVKLFSNMDSEKNYLTQKIIPNDRKLLAIPTTAGSGSEATSFAVIYYKSIKQSILSPSCLPSVVVMDASSLNKLPLYQKKATLLDALCHALESFWSINSTFESKKYSERAIELILENRNQYLKENEDANYKMLEASYMAGKAINIAKTTAGHAMSYQLSMMYGIAHGHAAGLCVAALFPYMVRNIDKCIDKRGTKYLMETFQEIAFIMKVNTIEDAGNKINEIFISQKSNLDVPIATEEEFNILNNTVNIERMKNNPVKLEIQDINYLYHQILKKY